MGESINENRDLDTNSELSEEQKSIMAESSRAAHSYIAEKLGVSAEATREELEVLKVFKEEEGLQGGLEKTREYFGLPMADGHTRADVYNAVKKLRAEINSRGK